MKYGIQDSCCQRHPQSVVKEWEEKIFSDVAHCAPAQPTSFDDAPENVFHKCYSAGLHCHIGSRSHGDTHLGLSLSRSIIHSITGHRDDFPLRLELLYDCGLLRRQNISLEIDAQLLRDYRGSRL